MTHSLTCSRSKTLSVLRNPLVSYALLCLYATRRNIVVLNTHNNNLQQAFQLFHLVDTIPTDSTFNRIIFALATTNPVNSISFYSQMLPLNVKLHLITLLSLLPACINLTAFNLIKEIHSYAVRNSIHLHHQLSSALIEAYKRCGSLRCASLVFEKMRDESL